MAKHGASHRSKKVVVPPGQKWSEEFPGYIDVGGGTFRKQLSDGVGKYNSYFVKAECATCGKVMLQQRVNSQRGQRPCCSPECRMALRIPPDGKKRIMVSAGKREYVTVKCEGHPRAYRSGYVLEHILNFDKAYGVCPKGEQQIHHIDMDTQNNDIGNLYLCQNSSEHHLIHGSLNKCVAELMELGVLKFDPVGKAYFVDDDVMYRPDEVPGTRCTPKKYWLDNDSE